MSSTLSTSMSTHTTSTSLSWVPGVGRHLLDHHLVTVDGAGAFLNQLLGHSLPLEGDKTEVLGFVVLALVDRSDDFSNVAKLTEILFDLLLSYSRVGKLSNVDFAWLHICLLHRDSFTLA